MSNKMENRISNKKRTDWNNRKVESAFQCYVGWLLRGNGISRFRGNSFSETLLTIDRRFPLYDFRNPFSETLLNIERRFPLYDFSNPYSRNKLSDHRSGNCVFSWQIQACPRKKTNTVFRKHFRINNLKLLFCSSCGPLIVYKRVQRNGRDSM